MTSAISAPSALKKEWKRFAPFGTCGGTWTHTSGYIVQHCGHPTALYPYYVLTPAGEVITANLNVKRSAPARPRTFARLGHAQAFALEHHAQSARSVAPAAAAPAAAPGLREQEPVSV